jgi:hypothetical protein
MVQGLNHRLTPKLRKDRMSPTPEPSAGPPGPRPASLSERDQRVLDFERRWWRHVGAKEEAISEVFGLSTARYYQLLNSVIDTPEALRYDPILVGRLLRARDSRVRARAARRFPTSSPSGD